MMTDIYLDKCEHLSPFEDVKDKFNKYCAEVMGYECHGTNRGHYVGECWHVTETFNPYDDLNQMADVVERLIRGNTMHLNKYRHDLYYGAMAVGIKQAFRDFISSTMPEDT